MDEAFVIIRLTSLVANELFEIKSLLDNCIKDSLGAGVTLEVENYSVEVAKSYNASDEINPQYEEMIDNLVADELIGILEGS
jgi:hypothetical protein